MNLDSTHIMIDLETMGTSCISAIVSIGAVKFSLNGDIKNLCHIGVDLKNCEQVGMEIDGKTVMWWLAQPQENQEKLLKLVKKPLKQALEELFSSFNQNRLNPETIYIWSHGSNFDTVIIENACKLVGVPLWWSYKNIRDTRTLFDVCDYKYQAKGGHDALEDAVSQAEAVIAACTQSQ